MKKLLNVPYISQWDTTAGYSKNDCIPVSSAMLIAYYKGNITPDQISTKIGVTGLITYDQIRTALAFFNYKILGSTFKTIADLKKSIDSGVPFIAIVHYGDLPNRQDTYTGGHAVVVTGYDDNNIYVNDPNFWGDRRLEGNNKMYPTTAFDKAWQSKLDGNSPGNFWYFDLPVPGNSLAMVLDEDIPTAIEDKYDLKTYEWYSKYWTGEELIRDAIKTHKEYDELESKYSDLQKISKADKVIIDNQIKEIQSKITHIETLQKSNSELTAQISVMSGQVQSAIDEKKIAVDDLELLQKAFDDMSDVLDETKDDLDIANAKLSKKLQGYSRWQLFKALFGFY